MEKSINRVISAIQQNEIIGIINNAEKCNEISPINKIPISVIIVIHAKIFKFFFVILSLKMYNSPPKIGINPK